MTETTTTATGRTIEQILAIRLRAAELRVLERATAVLKAQQQELAKAVENKRLAEEALTLVRRESQAQKGLPVEPVVYDPATLFATRHYAAVLMLDNPQLDAAEALAQAHKDEVARFEDYYARYGEHQDVDDEDEA